MQVLATEQKKKSRPLRICDSCGKEGYLYAQLGGKRQHQHRYTYTIHYNEPPIGYYSNGRVKYRMCKGARLYQSIEEAEKAERHKEKKARVDLHLFLKVTCPKCGEKGKLYKYIDREKTYDRYRVMHEKDKRCHLQEKHEKRLGLPPRKRMLGKTQK